VLIIANHAVISFNTLTVCSWTPLVVEYYKEGTQSSVKLICFHYLMKGWGTLYCFLGPM